ncbi:MAG: outer membrane beta-barrel protein, partial [Planctomycetota bacterium]
DIFASSNEFEFSMDESSIYSGALGFYVGPARVEVEASYTETDYDNFGSPFGSVGVTGDLEYFTLGANLYYDIPTPINGLDLYLGGGVGVARLRAQGNLDTPITFVDQFGNPVGTLDSLDDSLNTFTYQFMAGLSYEVVENVTLTGGYRVRLFSETSNNTEDNFAFDYREHHVNIFEAGIRFDF